MVVQIRKYERVALEHLAQADYHKQLARLRKNTEFSAQLARLKEELLLSYVCLAN